MKPQTRTVLSLLALLLVSSPIFAQSLPFRILEQEQQRKGGLKYVLFVVKAAVTDPKVDLQSLKSKQRSVNYCELCASTHNAVALSLMASPRYCINRAIM